MPYRLYSEDDQWLVFATAHWNARRIEPTARVVHLRHSLLLFILWPTITHPRHDLACVRTTSEREREWGRETERENNYSTIAPSTNQNTYTSIVRVYPYTYTHTSTSLLSIIRSRSLTELTKRLNLSVCFFAWRTMPADRFAPYSVPSHHSQNEYRKVSSCSKWTPTNAQRHDHFRMRNQLWRNDDVNASIEVSRNWKISSWTMQPPMYVLSSLFSLLLTHAFCSRMYAAIN